MALGKLRRDVKEVCSTTKKIDELEDLLLHPLDLHRRRRKIYDSKDRIDRKIKSIPLNGHPNNILHMRRST